MVRLTTTRATFVCTECIIVKAGDKLEEVLKDIAQLVRSECEDREALSDGSKSQGISDRDCANNEPSAPPASQMPES